MLYHLLAPLAKQHILFNLFNYITFRAACAIVTALVLAFLCGPAIIRWLREALSPPKPTNRWQGTKPVNS